MMSRKIITKAEAEANVLVRRELKVAGGVDVQDLAPAAKEPQQADRYIDKLVKYIPAEIIAFYACIAGIAETMPENQKALALWLALGLGVLATPIYLVYVHGLGGKQWPHLVISMVAYAAYVYVLGGPFKLPGINLYYPAWGSIVVAIFTLIIGALPPEVPDRKQNQ